MVRKRKQLHLKLPLVSNSNKYVIVAWGSTTQTTYYSDKHLHVKHWLILTACLVFTPVYKLKRLLYTVITNSTCIVLCTR